MHAPEAGSVNPDAEHTMLTYKPEDGDTNSNGLGGASAEGSAGTITSKDARSGTEPGKSLGQKGGQDKDTPCAAASVSVVIVRRLYPQSCSVCKPGHRTDTGGTARWSSVPSSDTHSWGTETFPIVTRVPALNGGCKEVRARAAATSVTVVFAFTEKAKGAVVGALCRPNNSAVSTVVTAA